MEDDFLEALVASERIGEWQDVIRESAFNSQLDNRTRNALRSLKEAIIDNKIYAEEAVLQGIAEIIQKVADHNDEECARLAGSILSFLGKYQEKVVHGEVREYCIDGKHIKLYEQALTHGVGAKVWEAAEHLCKAMLTTNEHIRGKRVLELGSGCGLNGLFAAIIGAKAVYLTDFEDSLLENLTRSASLNDSFVVKTYKVNLEEAEISTLTPTVFVAKLDWMDYTGEVGEVSAYKGTFPVMSTSERFPVIIGSDLMYEMKPTLALLDVIDKHLDYGGFCLFSMKVRYKNLLQTFITLGQKDYKFRIGIRNLGKSLHEHRSSEKLFDGGQVLIYLDRTGYENHSESSRNFVWQDG